jgi:amino acid permease
VLHHFKLCTFAHVLTVQLSAILFCSTINQQFNTLSVYAKLVNPEQRRRVMRDVVSTAMSAAMFVYMLIGLFGYTYAYSHTQVSV